MRLATTLQSVKHAAPFVCELDNQHTAFFFFLFFGGRSQLVVESDRLREVNNLLLRTSAYDRITYLVVFMVRNPRGS